MERKLRQVTDNIHGTVYLSDFESRMISTPFFYRLHDIYQSSTVYMAFPSNRTKRYEHCLGTMEQAGQMFFSATTNALKDVRRKFVEEINSEFETITEAFKERALSTFYVRNVRDQLAMALPKSSFESAEKLKSLISQGMQDGVISDIALSHQAVSFFDLLEKNNSRSKFRINDINDVLLCTFLYQCTLEAIRLSALFHDIGHPPYSHIIEETLVELYTICTQEGREGKKFIGKKVEDLRKLLNPFIGVHEAPDLLLKSDKKIKAPLHEQIGLKMLQSAFEGVLEQLLKESIKETPAHRKMVHSLYYVTVVEFTFAILLEKSPIFTTLHRMIDGPIDSDRFDYIVRDSENAGIDWGRIPYKRIVCSAKLASLTNGNNIVVAFPEKMTDDLDDILVARYKVFARINYHHRSTKTSRLLQKAVCSLAKDYLYTPEGEECICPDIRDLWMSLGATLGKREEENKAAKWNDSWLISVLHSALIKLSDEGTCEALESEDQPGRSKAEILRLRDLLEEVLLNRKHYYPLLKRQKDAKNLIEAILNRAGITKGRLEELLRHEYGKLFQKTGEEAHEAQESLYRIGRLMDHILPGADFEELEIYLLGGCCEEHIVRILKQEMCEGTIRDYIVSPNSVRFKLGISDEPKDRIYLFRADGRAYSYDIYNTLFPLLQAQRMASLWLNVYVNLPKPEESESVLDSLTTQIQNCIGDALAEEFNKLFPHSFDKG